MPPAAPVAGAGPLSDFQGELARMLVQLAAAAGRDSVDCKAWADVEALVRLLRPAQSGRDARGPDRPRHSSTARNAGA